MNVKELETRLGLPRASIRFYEKEGLLSPRRKSNGYRDYTEEDAAVLQKIAFLRQLELPLDTIRRVQNGELPLSVALRRQREALLEKRMQTDNTVRVCDAVLRDQTSYSDLRPDQYQHQLPPPAQRALPPENRQYPAAAGHYWRRLFARDLDGAVYALIWVLFSTYVLRLSFDSAGWGVYAAIAHMALIAALEPVMLHFLGWTPGKWLMGLRLTDVGAEGEIRPDYGDAFLRTLGVMFAGLGLGIPGISTICGFFAWRRADKGQEQFWDEGSELEYTYRGESRRQGLWDAVLVLACVGLAAVSVTVMLAGPPALHRGRLTRAEYVDTVNDLIRRGEEDHRGFALTGTGAVTTERNIAGQDVYIVIDAHSLDALCQSIEERDGFVCAVAMRATPGVNKNDPIVSTGAWLKLLTVQALTGASRYQTASSVGDLLDRGAGTATLNGWEVQQALENPDGTKYTGKDFYYQMGAVFCVTDDLPADTQPPSLVFHIRYVGE